MQTVYTTNYYLSTPTSIIELFENIYMFPSETKKYCPLYAPLITDGCCRFCSKNILEHRKYFVYSSYASKIQRAYLRFKFRKFYKNNYNLFLYPSPSILPLPAKILKYKILYYRKWSRYTLELFLKRQ